MVKTNHFDGFGFSFIQIAAVLKKIFPLCRRLVWDGVPYVQECAATLITQDDFFDLRHARKRAPSLLLPQPSTTPMPFPSVP